MYYLTDTNKAASSLNFEAALSMKLSPEKALESNLDCLPPRALFTRTKAILFISSYVHIPNLP